MAGDARAAEVLQPLVDALGTIDSLAHNRHYAFFVVPGHGVLVTRLTGYLTLA